MLTRSGDIDKKLLLDVVDEYGKTYTSADMEQGSYNSFFHEKMGNMLQGIVTKYDYTDQELTTLTIGISKGAEGTYAVEIASSERDMEEYGVEAAYSERRGHDMFVGMAQQVESAYKLNDREYNHPIKSASERTINPIVLQKTGNNGNNG